VVIARRWLSSRKLAARLARIEAARAELLKAWQETLDENGIDSLAILRSIHVGRRLSLFSFAVPPHFNHTILCSDTPPSAGAVWVRLLDNLAIASEHRARAGLTMICAGKAPSDNGGHEGSIVVRFPIAFCWSASKNRKAGRAGFQSLNRSDRTFASLLLSDGATSCTSLI
jgi:hypothetical protein